MDSRNRPCSFAPKQKVKGNTKCVGTYGTDGYVKHLNVDFCSDRGVLETWAQLFFLVSRMLKLFIVTADWEAIEQSTTKNKQNICKLNSYKVGLSIQDDKLNHSATFMSDDRICISKRGRNMDFKECC